MSDNFLGKGDIFDSPEEVAKRLYQEMNDSLAVMTEEEFESWLDAKMEKQYIQVGTLKIPVAEGYKKAVWHYVAYLYYWKTPKRQAFIQLPIKRMSRSTLVDCSFFYITEILQKL